METYASGDADGLLGCLTEDWVLHEEDGSTTSRADIADITRSHAESFPEKSLEYLHELVEGNRVAHHVTFTLVHSGRYHDLEPTGKHVVLGEMIFHRFENDLIAESWRMTFPTACTAHSPRSARADAAISHQASSGTGAAALGGTLRPSADVAVDVRDVAVAAVLVWPGETTVAAAAATGLQPPHACREDDEGEVDPVAARGGHPLCRRRETSFRGLAAAKARS